MNKNSEERSPSDKMDISENTQDSPVSLDLDECRPTFAVNTASSSSNTISNIQTNLEETNADLEVGLLTLNMNALKTRTNETLDNRSKNQQPSQHHTLTSVTVNSHPLMLNDSDSEDSYNNSNRKVNYPDVVPQIEQKHQPLRLANPLPQSSKRTTTKTTTTTSITSKTSKKSTRDVVNNVNNNNTSSTHKHPNFKRPLYREPSPDLNDFMSSDSEPDVSQYQTEVHPTFQTVALVSNPPRMQQSTSSPKLLSTTRQKIPLTENLKSDDMSSNDDSLSNESIDFPDEDGTDDLYDEFNLDLPANPSQPEKSPNLLAMSPSSSDNKPSNSATNGNFLVSHSKNEIVLNRSCVECIPEYSAADEARNVRNFQLITLPDGKTREIDMKVIEPYKRILSHGGYLKSGGHNAIIVFSACHLPDRSRADYNYVMNNLFFYVVKTLEQLVTEDYVLVYLHGASSRKNSPPFPWLKKCYQLLDRRLRKSLKSCFIVHPTFWLKSLIWMTRPFISSKFWRKLVYVRSLEELYTLVPVEKNSIPDKVKNYNSRHS